MNNDFLLLLPEFMVTGLAFVILTLDFFLRAERKHWLGIVGAVGLRHAGGHAPDTVGHRRRLSTTAWSR